MDFFSWIDNFLIDEVFEKISHKFQRLTGKTCFFLAKQCCLAGLVAIALSLYFDFNLVRFILDLIFSLFMLAFMVLFHITDKIIFKPSEARTANPLRLLLFRHRFYALVGILIFVTFITPLVILMISLINIAAWMKFSVIIFLWLGLNFASCTPLPPGKSKVRQWAEAIKKFFSPAMPEPEPATVSATNYKIIS